MPRKYEFGLTPWGAYFIRAMESLADQARLKRGRSYAANGNVFRLSIENGVVSAMVEGNYKPWYDVRIVFKPLNQSERTALFRLINDDPMLVGRIAIGELPAELIDRLRRANVRLLPERWNDMRRSCTCPDYGDPCKHMAAVYYVLAQEIDRDPSALFRLRGVDIFSEFQDKKGLQAKKGLPAQKKLIARDEVELLPDPLPIDLVRPWKTSEKMEMLEFPGIRAYDKTILGLLPPPPPLAPYDLSSALAGFYRDIDQHWDRILELILPEDELEERARTFPQSRIEIHLFRGEKSSQSKKPFITAIRASGKKEKLSALEAMRLCLAIDTSEGSLGYRFLREFSRAMRSIIAAKAFVPDIAMYDAVKKGKRAGGTFMRVVWKPALFSADIRSLFALIEPLVPVPVFIDESAAHGEPVSNASTLKVVKVSVAPREKSRVPSPHATLLLLASDILSDIVTELRYLPSGVKDISHPVTAALFRNEDANVSSPLHRSIPKAMRSWLSVFDLANSGFQYELVVKNCGEIDTSNWGDEDDSIPDGMPRYELSATVRQSSTATNKVKTAQEERIPLHEAAQRFGISALTFPALLSTFVPELAQLGSKASVILDEIALSRFVIESAALLGNLGVTIALPKELCNLIKPRAVLTAKKGKKSGNLVSFLTLDSLLSFEWKVSIGDRLISAAEFERMVKAGTALVRFRQGFLRLEASEAASMLERIKKGPKPDAFDVLQEYLAGTAEFDQALQEKLAAMLPRTIDGAAQAKVGTSDVMPHDVMSDGAMPDSDIPLPASLNASLRPYQARGFRWIATTMERGFGCILADDMGLGKTVQAIACILHLKETKSLTNGALICAPATLITNWERELEKFAPSLSVSTYYGAGRHHKSADILLTSYETFLRDKEKFKDKKWDIAILDEAHLIKNPEAKRSKAVKEIVASDRLALSGTPVENHLGELWSIFDFVIPGYLHTLEHFRSNYRKPIEVDKSKEVADRLRRVTAPFLLRRLKTDRSIIADLPDKIVVNEYATLTAEQAALYESTVRDCMKKIADSEGIARRGLILALITGLKQICNHPRNYDKDSAPSAERSGKTRLLLSLLESIAEAGEKVLVFSQYVEMLDILRQIIAQDRGVEPFMLHGKMTRTKRDAAIEGFRNASGPAILLISLKAGGLGLNLTEATRVIHFDLWFNPAVENQATDRAFRIGQRKNVFVHRLITKDSFEEKIDAILTTKRDLAEMAISAGETWITELDNKALADLVKR